MKIKLKNTVYTMRGDESAHELRDLIAECKEMWDELEEKPSLTQDEVIRRDELYEEVQELKVMLSRKERSEADATRRATGSVIPERKTDRKMMTFTDLDSKALKRMKAGETLELGIDLRSFLGAKRQERAVLTPAALGGDKLIPSPLFSGVFSQSLSSNAYLQEFTMDSTENGTKYPYIDRDNRITIQNKGYTDALTEYAYTFSDYAVAFVNHYAYTGMHNDMVRDGIRNLGQVIESEMQRDLQNKLGSACIAGNGAANAMTGLIYYSGVQTANFSGAELTSWDHVADWTETLAGKNVNMGNLSLVMSPRNWNELASLKDTTNQPLWQGKLISDLNIRIYVTNHVPDAYIIFGDLSKFVLHYWRGAEVEFYASQDAKIAEDHVVIRGLVRADLKSPEPDHVLVVANVGTSVS